MSKSRSPVAFGQYVITRRIARGGMAEIYRARTRSTSDRPSSWIAVKMMRHSLGHEELREHLFKREAKIASMINHENVIPLVEFGLEMERYYISMEYVRGRDLSHLLKNEKKGRELIPFELGLYIGLQAAAGLGHAHRLHDEIGNPLGIVHRDISPGNVMVGYDGTVKVLDFGVARMNESEGMRTQTGTLRGKFAYMSPEQTLGESLDARSDVFSLGTVLYELLTGANCFRADNPIATLERVQRVRPVPPSRANREIPKSVDRILARCLAKDRKRRFQDCTVLYEALGEFLEKRNFAGKPALSRHMSDRFAWEKDEEEKELLREEEEVALFDVVDFALLPEGGSDLDAENLAVSQQEEASQSEVNRAAPRAGNEDDENVFDEGEAQSARERAPSPSQIFANGIMGIDAAEEKTIAQPRARFKDPEEIGRGDSVELSSLLAAESPSAVEDIPTPRDQTIRRPVSAQMAAPVAAGAAPLLLVGRRAPEFLAGLLAPAGVGTIRGGSTAVEVLSEKRTIAVPGFSGARFPKTAVLIGVLALSVIAVATLISFSIQSDNEVQAALPEIESSPAPQTKRKIIRVEEVVVAPPPSEPKTEPKKEEPRVEAKKEEQRVEAKKEELAIQDPPPGDAPAEPEKQVEKQQPQRPRERPRQAPPMHHKPVRFPEKPSEPAAVNTRGKQIGYLNVGAKPWAEIAINGKAWPYQTPQAGIELPVGRHTVTLFNRETGVTRTKVVQIKQGTYQTISVDMTKK
jgi:eukaryotic-like serine/threonine-protein kinase